MTFSRRAIARSVLGVGVSVVAVWLLLRSVDLAAAAQVLRTADPAWIGVMLLTSTTDIAMRGARCTALRSNGVACAANQRASPMHCAPWISIRRP